nr:hypothetical protein [Tanacetum cinerariifolium]
MAIFVIPIYSDSSEESVRTSTARVILFGTIPTTIPPTIPTTDLPVIYDDTPLIHPLLHPLYPLYNLLLPLYNTLLHSFVLIHLTVTLLRDHHRKTRMRSRFLDNSSRDNPSDSLSKTSSDSHSDTLSDSSSRHSFSGRPISDAPCDSLTATSARPSHKRCRSSTTPVPVGSPVPGALSPVRTDLLPPRQRIRDFDSITDFEDRGSDIDTCIAFSNGIAARWMDVRVEVGTVAKEETQPSVRGTIEIGVDRRLCREVWTWSYRSYMITWWRSRFIESELSRVSRETREIGLWRLASRALLCQRGLVMAIFVIPIYSDSSEESVRTSTARVILFGTIPTTIPPTIPTTDLPVIYDDTPLIHPLLHPLYPLYNLLLPLYNTLLHSFVLIHLTVTLLRDHHRKTRMRSRFLDNSSRDNPSDSLSKTSSDSHSDTLSDSSSRHSFSGRPISDAPCDSLTATSARPSHKRCRSSTTPVPVGSPVPGALSPDTYEPYTEPDIDFDVQADIDTCIAFSNGIAARWMDVRVEVGTVAKEETQPSVRGTIEIGVDRVTHPVV